MTQAIALRIEGMTCVSCAEHVEKALEQVRGVHTAAVSYPKEKAEVTTDAGVGIELLAAAVATLGYRAIAVDTPADHRGMTTTRMATEANYTLPLSAVAGLRWRQH